MKTKVILVGEDDPDVQLLVETVFSMDARFSFTGVTDAAEDSFELARTTGPEVIVLDHGWAGHLTGLEAAPRLKEVAPASKIIFFTAHAEVREAAEAEPAIDAFVLKPDSTQLLPVAQQLMGLGTSVR